MVAHAPYDDLILSRCHCCCPGMHCGNSKGTPDSLGFVLNLSGVCPEIGIVSGTVCKQLSNLYCCDNGGTEAIGAGGCNCFYGTGSHDFDDPGDGSPYVAGVQLSCFKTVGAPVGCEHAPEAECFWQALVIIGNFNECTVGCDPAPFCPAFNSCNIYIVLQACDEGDGRTIQGCNPNSREQGAEADLDRGDFEMHMKDYCGNTLSFSCQESPGDCVSVVDPCVNECHPLDSTGDPVDCGSCAPCVDCLDCLPCVDGPGPDCPDPSACIPCIPCMACIDCADCLACLLEHEDD